jgi:polyhydroxybutyrate depolymerase
MKYSNLNLLALLAKCLSVLFVSYLLITPVQAADVTLSLVHDGQEREYLVHTPPNFNKTENLPMVMLFHGGGGNPKSIVRQSGMNTVADTNGFIAVYPAGIGARIGNMRTWNAIKCCGRAAKENIDDVGFASALIDKMELDYGIDTSRVYATGHSNGAMITYRLACELSEKITAIATNAGTLALNDCQPERPMPVLHFHGTADPCIDYDGGKNCGGCFSKLAVKGTGLTDRICEPVPTTLSRWARINKCSNERIESYNKGSVLCEKWQECQQPVTLCTIEGAGHTWAGGSYASKFCELRAEGKRCRHYMDVMGTINTQINTSEIIWRFFSQHKSL